ncbi:uncharacterized protein KY384_005852 [Bacidia gigantensis]|uniref:uncharacterized protein n=1 Tax=Bacidia gigantensis TaxID=2732470 RepID=UPI001D04D1EF|nr:uncharacterized protein KY384_005852 [Bacidia gigantensis]KAG8529217.1 hypothetical protein KY384_005852 [Bacidia gigantensis]
MHDARLQSSFHARGPTRMLMWALDHQTAGLLPHTIDQRRKHAVGLEAHCHVDQVVGFNTAAQRVSQREQRLDIASSQRARQRMKEQKVFTPPTREDTTIEDSKGHAEVNRSWHEEYRDLVARFAAGQLSRFVGDSPAPWTDLSSRKSRKEVKAFTPEFERLKYFKRIMQGQSNLITKARSFVEKQAEIDALDLERYDPSITPTQMQNLVSEIKKRCASLNDGLCKAPVKIRNVFYLRSDDYYAFYMPTGPLMMWDRRNYEPLKASPDEFHLPREVTLLDFQAKPPDTLPLTENQSMYWDMITSCLYSPRGFHNLKYLDSIAPGAYESLVPKIGEFRDAREGGRYDVDMLRVRLLTPKMLWRLALEWDHWLFKPDIYEMAGSFETHVDTERKVASRYIMPV